MRFALFASVIVALSAFVAPSASAQSGSFLEDPAGDTAFDTFGGPQVPLANAQFDAADLLGLDVAEDADAFTFTIAVKTIASMTNSVGYRVVWTWSGTEYYLYAYHRVLPGADDSWFAYLQTYHEEEGWNYVADLEPVVDTSGNKVSVLLPKAYMVDGRNRMPAIGDKLDDLYVRSSSSISFLTIGNSVSDRMPDSGEEAYVVAVGDIATGKIRLSADDRIRVSNGGSTTFVFRALLENTADVDDTVDLSLADLPAGWNGTIQSPIKVPADGERTVTALVSVPFEHDHGGYSSFNLTAVSKRDAGSRASVRMGVLHTPIPQPAGHHAELYLHASNLNQGLFGDTLPYSPGFVNTDSDHTQDAAEAAADMYGGSETEWRLELNPALRMGLDFDVTRTGEIVGTIMPRQTGEGTLSAKLILYTESQDAQDFNDGNEDSSAETLVLAESDESAITMDLSNAVPFKLTLTPTEDADYVEYAKSQNLALILTLSGDGFSFPITSQQGPSLKTADFKASLPLNEYHDRLTGLADAEEALELKAEGVVEKLGRAGTTLVYPFTLRNTEDEEMVVDLDVAGGDAELGVLAPEGSVTLGPKESVKLTLAVAIPPNATANQELEVLVFAHARDDPTKIAIARTKTTVAGGEMAAQATGDESAVFAAAKEQAEKDTPFGGALLALAAVSLALLARRRRG